MQTYTKTDIFDTYNPYLKYIGMFKSSQYFGKLSQIAITIVKKRMRDYIHQSFLRSTIA